MIQDKAVTAPGKEENDKLAGGATRMVGSMEGGSGREGAGWIVGAQGCRPRKGSAPRG